MGWKLPLSKGWTRSVQS